MVTGRWEAAAPPLAEEKRTPERRVRGHPILWQTSESSYVGYGVQLFMEGILSIGFDLA
jgi:hypothetical protein